MAIVQPFRALRPAASHVARVASPPYDVINSLEARALVEGEPDRFVRVARPEVTMDSSIDEHDPVVYAQGRVVLHDFVSRGVLRQDERAHFYVYAQHMGNHRQVGLVACVSVQDYVDDVIRKHEKTRADKEDDRTQHINTMGAHDEPVFLTYRAEPAIDATIQRLMNESPTYDFALEDGVRHLFWVVPPSENEALIALFARVPNLYVADGHHRSAAAARVRSLRSGHDGSVRGEHDVFPAVLFPHDQMQILAYNRLIRDTVHTPEVLRSKLQSLLQLSPASNVTVPSKPGEICVYLRETSSWYVGQLPAVHADHNDPTAHLDCSRVQNDLLSALFDITDPRRDKRVDFVGGIRGTKELEERVQREGFTLALSLYPTQIEQLLQVSDAGMLMPPKSTWFEPKLRSGLFVHLFDPAELR